MGKYESGLLSCSFCGEDVEFYGKDGAILQTKCPSCGMTSDMLSDKYLDQENQQQVEVYYNRKAPVSTTPPSG